MSRYELLHYRGDLTPDIHEGDLLGTDEVGRPYAVIDAEFEPCPECDPTVGWPGPLWWKSADPDREACPGCDGSGGQTTVHLQYATPEQITAAVTS